MYHPSRVTMCLIAPAVCLAFAPRTLADVRLIPLDGSEANVQPADFGYQIETGATGDQTAIHIRLDPEAARNFSHAHLTLTKAEQPIVEATLGLERDADQGGRMRVIFDSRFADDGELIVWSRPFEGRPIIDNFGGFRISIKTLLANMAKEKAAGESAEPESQQAETLPVGRWEIEFANGVVETCEIRSDGTAAVAEPKRNSGGRVARDEGAVVITFDDDRVERWMSIGDRMVVEHWYPADSFPCATPVLGIADRALTDDGALAESGAASAGAEGPDRPAVAEIDDHWERWKKTRGQGNSYRYIVQYSCECPAIDYGAVLVEVEAEKAIAARFARSGQEIPERAHDLFLRTMDEIFEQLRKAAAEGADELTAVYHPKSGYPLYAFVDRDADAKDDEYELEVFLLSPWISVPGVTPELPARHLRENDDPEDDDEGDPHQTFFKAIGDGRFDAVAEAVRAAPELVDAEYQYGGTPLYWSAFSGQEKIAALFLEHGAEIDARGIESATPLYEASRRGHAGVVKLLLDNRADIEAANESGLTPLYAAVAWGHEVVAKILLKAGANPNGPPGERRPFRPGEKVVASPLMLAVSSVTRATTKRALTREEEQRQAERRQTARRIAKMLIVHPQAELNQLYMGQLAPLHMTAAAGDVELTRLLLEHDADPNIQDRSRPTRRPRPDGFTPLHHAAAAGNIELMELLEQHGANPKIKNSLGQTPADVLNDEKPLPARRLRSSP